MLEADQKEEFIRREAHLLWLAEGKPDGRDKEHWAEAECLVQKIERARAADEAASSPGLGEFQAEGS
jgi:hypothetical protein